MAVLELPIWNIKIQYMYIGTVFIWEFWNSQKDIEDFEKDRFFTTLSGHVKRIDDVR